MKKGKLIKRIVLSLLAVILIVMLAAFLYVKIAVLPKIQQYMSDPEILAVLEEIQAESVENNLDINGETINEAGTEIAPENGDKTQNENGEKNQTGDSSEKKDPGAPAQTKPSETKQPTVPNKNTSKRMEDVAKDLPPADVAAATALAAKVDPGYILGLMRGGLTQEERKELKAYLTSRLSGAEISQGIALYNKYAYLLN